MYPKGPLSSRLLHLQSFRGPVECFSWPCSLSESRIPCLGAPPVFMAEDETASTFRKTNMNPESRGPQRPDKHKDKDPTFWFQGSRQAGFQKLVCCIVMFIWSLGLLETWALKGILFASRAVWAENIKHAAAAFGSTKNP